MPRPSGWYAEASDANPAQPPWPARLADTRSLFAERRDAATVGRPVYRIIHGVRLPFWVQTTRANSAHPCSVDDIAHLLSAWPAQYLTGFGGRAGLSALAGVVLWQPPEMDGPGKRLTRAPVFARVVYFAELAELDGRTGPVLLVAAQALPLSLTFRRRMDEEQLREVEALAAEAVCLAYGARTRELTLDLDAARRTLLYRAIPTELAHLAEFAEAVALPGRTEDGAWLAACRDFLARPYVERVQSARARADAEVERLRAREELPFARHADPAVMAADGLSMADFVAPIAD